MFNSYQLKSLLILLVICLTTFQVEGQIVANGDFESNTGCATGLGQINLLDDWFIVVESADYYNCGLTSTFFPIEDDVDFGDGYVGFASYGDGIGSAEAIGQQLSTPLVAGQTYSVAVELKMPNGGSYSDLCGGFCVYGFADAPPTGIVANHTSLLPGAIELGCSAAVENTLWECGGFIFEASENVEYIVITTSLNPNCGQNIFVDNLIITEGAEGIISACSEYQACVGEDVFLDTGLGFDTDWYQVVDGSNEFIQTSESLLWNVTESTVLLYDNNGEETYFPITALESPTPDLGDDITVCPGEEATLDAGIGWEEIAWNGEVGEQFLFPVDEGTYEVTVTLNGCEGTDEVEVIFADAPDFSSLLVSNPGCVGQCNGQIELTLEPDWTLFMDGAESAGEMPDLCEGIIGLMMTNGSCDTSMTIELTADPLPVIDLPLNYVICSGSEVAMTATSTETDLTYNWDTGTVGETETRTPNEGDVFCVAATDGNGCTSIGHCTEIFFYSELVLTGAEDVIPCPGEAINLQAYAAGGQGTYEWQWVDENGAVLGAEDLLFYTATEPITLTVQLIDGCTPDGVTADVLVQTVVLPTPELVSNVETVCIPVPAQFSLLNVEDFGAINWDFGDVTVGAGLEVSHTYETQGCFDISVGLIHNEGCPLNIVFEDVLCAFDLPVADFSIREGTLVYNSIDEIHFDNTSEGAIDYIWTLNGSEVSTEESTVIEGWELPGVYEVCLEAINEHGCADLLCTEILVNLPPNVFIPNAFTPDLDGINEVFKPVLNFEPNAYTFEIFDRWGELIFVSNDPEIGWIGNVDNGGYYVQTEVYTYQLTIEMPDTGNAEQFEGMVTVLR